ncbi:MAG: hypothetical protein HS104_09965 [Polyangiaceae bacterium]|nr:hypothetical protein [Polyangiaceae bacterium]MCE7890035.1 hypothetical protein [Sorangiineae bacterium PRO1]MCL4750866.1 hypothetical protein [Myxococcales bacterium]
MAYRDSGSQLLSRILELEAQLDGLRPRVEALEGAVSRLEVNVAMGPSRAPLGEDGLARAVAADEIRDKHLAEQVGHLVLRVAALEKNLAVTPRPARRHDDVRALVDEALPKPKRRR